RPTQSDSRLVTALAEAGRRGLARRIELAPLSAPEAEKLLGDGIDRAHRDALYRETGGNPFYLEQLASAARRGAMPLPDEESAGRGVPAAVSAAIQGEIGPPSALECDAGAAAAPLA